MTRERHTPGPWRVIPGDSVVHIEGDGYIIAQTSTKPYWQRHDEVDLANAALIAAAPDLYEALKDLLDAYANEVPYANDPDDPDCPRAARKAYAAISRAESTALSGQT